MTSCRPRSASGRTRAGGGRSSARSRRGRAIACSTSRPARGWSPRSCSRAATARLSGSIRAPRCSRPHGRALRRRDGARVELIEGQAEALPFADASFDALTFTYLLRYVEDPAATVRELARVLRPGARIASLEFGVPPSRRCAAPGAHTRRSGCRCSAGSTRASGRRSAASSGRASAASTRATRSSGSSATGRRPASST